MADHGVIFIPSAADRLDTLMYSLLASVDFAMRNVVPIGACSVIEPPAGIGNPWLAGVSAAVLVSSTVPVAVAHRYQVSTSAVSVMYRPPWMAVLRPSYPVPVRSNGVLVA